MIALEKARLYLEQLGLAQAASVLESRLEVAAQKELPYADFLADLMGIEAAARRERYLRTRTRLAGSRRPADINGPCDLRGAPPEEVPVHELPFPRRTWFALWADGA